MAGLTSTDICENSLTYSWERTIKPWFEQAGERDSDSRLGRRAAFHTFCLAVQEKGKQRARAEAVLRAGSLAVVVPAAARSPILWLRERKESVRW